MQEVREGGTGQLLDQGATAAAHDTVIGHFLIGPRFSLCQIRFIDCAAYTLVVGWG
jgi:hypothetical protein